MTRTPLFRWRRTYLITRLGSHSRLRSHHLKAGNHEEAALSRARRRATGIAGRTRLRRCHTCDYNNYLLTRLTWRSDNALGLTVNAHTGVRTFRGISWWATRVITAFNKGVKGGSGARLYHAARAPRASSRRTAPSSRRNAPAGGLTRYAEGQLRWDAPRCLAGQRTPGLVAQDAASSYGVGASYRQRHRRYTSRGM